MVNTTIKIVKTHNATYYVDFDEGEIYLKNSRFCSMQEGCFEPSNKERRKRLNEKYDEMKEIINEFSLSNLEVFFQRMLPYVKK